MIENHNLEFSNNGMLNGPNANSFKEVSVIQSKDRQINNKQSSEKYLIFYFSTLIFKANHYM